MHSKCVDEQRNGLAEIGHVVAKHGRAKAENSEDRSRCTRAMRGKELPRKVKHSDSEEMVSNGKVKRRQVQKSNGKVKTRLVRQGKRLA